MMAAACLGQRPAWGLRPSGTVPGWVLCLLAVWLACACVAARANWNSQKPVLLERQGNSMTFIAGPQTGGAVANRTATFGATVSASDQVSGPGRTVGSTYTYTARRTLTGAAVGKAIARSLPLLSTALAVGELLSTIRCDEGFGGGVECDDGQATVTQTEYCTGLYTTTDGLVRGCASTRPLAVANLPPLTLGSSDCSRTVRFVEPDNAVVTVVSKSAGWAACDLTTEYWGKVTAQGTAQVCPAGESAHPFYLGLCTKQRNGWISTDFDTVEGIIEDHGNLSGRLPAIVPEMFERGVPIEHPSPTVDLPPATGWERETSTAPDGTITTRDSREVPAGRPDGWDWRREERSTVYPPNTVPDPIPVGTPGPGSGTGTSGGSSSAPAAEPPITCGLPDTPACKIDETGTSQDVELDDGVDPVEDLRDIIASPPVADIEFTWSFALPSSCSVLDVGTFGGQAVEVDLCRWQPMIHDIMSVVWAITGVLGAWMMLGRTFAGGS